MLADAPSFSETERKMRGKTYIIKGVRGLVLTGVLGTAVLGPAGTAFAIGPGESAFISSESVSGILPWLSRVKSSIELTAHSTLYQITETL